MSFEVANPSGSPETARSTAERARLALCGFFGMVESWGVDHTTAMKLLGSPPERTYYSWRSGRPARLSHDTLLRIGYLAGIWKSLQILYSDPALADSWLRRPNAHFGGQPPLERMAAGDITDLAAVRAYLDAARAPWS